MRDHRKVGLSFSLSSGNISSNGCIFFVVLSVAVQPSSLWSQLLLDNLGFWAGVFAIYCCIINYFEKSQLKTTNIISQNSWGLIIWEWLSQVVLAQDLSSGCSQDICWSCSHLKARVGLKKSLQSSLTYGCWQNTVPTWALALGLSILPGGLFFRATFKRVTCFSNRELSKR